MHLSKEQRARVACFVHGASFEDLPGPAEVTLVHVGDRYVATWNEVDGAIAGFVVVTKDGLHRVSRSDADALLWADVAEALDMAPFLLHQIISSGERRCTGKLKQR